MKFTNFISVHTHTLTDPPMVDKLSKQDIIEGRNLSITCMATSGNPNPIIFYWTKLDNPRFIHTGSTLKLSYIKRNSSGSYKCTAENKYSNGERGTHNQSMVVNVLCGLLLYITSYVSLLKNY